MQQGRKLITIIALAAAFSVAFAVVAYMRYVGSAASFEVSSSGKDWAEFGDYIGGVLGTAFSALAFIVLVWTLRIQQQQIAQFKEQDKFRELQNTLATFANTIDQTLGRDLPITYLESTGSESFLKLLIMVGGMGSEMPHNQKEQAMFDCARDALSSEFSLFVNTLDTYASLIHFYKDRGGDPDIARVYTARFELVARMTRAAAPHLGIGLSDDGYKVFELAT